MGLRDLTDRDAVLGAIAEFDALGRDRFLDKYGFEKALHYFLEYEGASYDSKAISGAAHGYQHGTPLVAAAFSGGSATVATQLESLGFIVSRPTALPDWSKDELILALDLYLRTREHMGYSTKSLVVTELSERLKELPIHPLEVRSLPRFRNPSGVAMKLHNFTSIDPARSQKGMGHGAAGDRQVWDSWAHRPAELREAAEAIWAAGRSERALATSGEDEEYIADEGELLFRAHRRYDRDPELVKRKRAAVLKMTGHLACEVCGFDSQALYGKGIVVIDAHHIVPLHRIGRTKNSVADLALVCPTCHRAIHAHRPFVTPAALRRKYLEGQLETCH